MFLSPDYMCVAPHSAAFYGPIAPYPCPAYRSAVCLPGYPPSYQYAWKTDVSSHGKPSNSKMVRKSKKTSSFSIEAILSRGNGKSPTSSLQSKRPNTGGQVHNFNSIQSAVFSSPHIDRISSQEGHLNNLHRFEDVMTNFSVQTNSQAEQYKTDAKVSQAIDPWRLDLAHQKSKRIRTIFSSEQLQRLEKEFKNQQYMVGAERLLLASDLQLSEAQVKVWFQNRRIKWRKENHERDQAKLADYRTRREEIRRKLGLSQRRRIVVGSLRGKRSSVGDDVRAKQPMISHEEETCSNVSMEKCYHHE